MRVLALDTATRTGWASGVVGGLPDFGSFALPKSQGNILGPFFQAFTETLDELLYVHEPDIVAFEAPLFLIYSSRPGRSNTSPITARKLMGLTCLTEMICYRKGIRAFEANTQSHKKHFCGRSFTKNEKPYPALVECHNRGIMVENHDEADAVAIWDYACHFADPEAAKNTDPLARAAGGW